MLQPKIPNQRLHHLSKQTTNTNTITNTTILPRTTAMPTDQLADACEFVLIPKTSFMSFLDPQN